METENAICVLGLGIIFCLTVILCAWLDHTQEGYNAVLKARAELIREQAKHLHAETQLLWNKITSL